MLQQPTPGLMETTDGHIIVGLPTEGMAGRERFIMRGLGISPMEDQSNPDPGYQYSTSQAARHFSNLLAAAESAYPQVNTFRLELSATQYDRLSDSGRQQYIATAVGYCQEIVDRGRYPLLYCGDSQVHGKLLSFYEKAYPLYGALHRALAALPEVQVRVLYEPFGKPYGISPGEWVRSMTELISFFREVLHYTNALFIDLRDRGRAFEEPQVTDLEKHDQDVLDSLAVFKDAGHNICFCSYLNHWTFPKKSWGDSLWLNAVGGTTNQHAVVTFLEYANSEMGGEAVNAKWVAKAVDFFTRRAIRRTFFSGMVAASMLGTDGNQLMLIDNQPTLSLTDWGRLAMPFYQ